MARIETYVFLDIETTGLPSEECNKTKITEISMVAVKRTHLLDTRPGAAPRVQHKVTFCLNPGRPIYPLCTEVTGLCNDLLEHEPYFNMDVFTMLDTFLKVLQKPVCLIAQNGYHFDYPIIKNHLVKLGASFCDDLLCADSFFAFYEILENKKLQEASADNCDNVKEELEEIELSATEMQLRNENTPKKQRTNINMNIKTPHRVKKKCVRRFPWSQGNKPKESYKLEDIYVRLLNRPPLEAHRAEIDCIMTLECVVACGEEFVQFVDCNHIRFVDVKPMKIGEPIGKYNT